MSIRRLSLKTLITVLYDNTNKNFQNNIYDVTETYDFILYLLLYMSWMKKLSDELYLPFSSRYFIKVIHVNHLIQYEHWIYNTGLLTPSNIKHIERYHCGHITKINSIFLYKNMGHQQHTCRISRFIGM
jgi:hypothetical protein